MTEIVSAAFGVSCARARRSDQIRKATPFSNVVSSSRRSGDAAPILSSGNPKRRMPSVMTAIIPRWPMSCMRTQGLSVRQTVTSSLMLGVSGP